MQVQEMGGLREMQTFHERQATPGQHSAGKLETSSALGAEVRLGLGWQMSQLFRAGCC
jgi:hypothetical protein